MIGLFKKHLPVKLMYLKPLGLAISNNETLLVAWISLLILVSFPTYFQYYLPRLHFFLSISSGFCHMMYIFPSPPSFKSTSTQHISMEIKINFSIQCQATRKNGWNKNGATQVYRLLSTKTQNSLPSLVWQEAIKQHPLQHFPDDKRDNLACLSNPYYHYPKDHSRIHPLKALLWLQ